MKAKDIEKRLKNEMDQMTPEVLGKVRFAPINELLTGCSPQQSFRKRLVTMILVLTLAIFLVMSVSLIAFAVMDKEQTASEYYFGLEITNGDDMQKIGVITNNKGEVLCVLDEVNLTVIEVDGASIYNLLALLITPVEGDSVYVEVHNDMISAAKNACDTAVLYLQEIYSGLDSEIIGGICSAVDEYELAVFINSVFGEERASTNMTISELVRQYFDMSRTLLSNQE